MGEMYQNHIRKLQNDFDKEARYYLECNSYNFEKALGQFEEDFNFEKKRGMGRDKLTKIKQK